MHMGESILSIWGARGVTERLWADVFWWAGGKPNKLVSEALMV